MLKVFSRYEAFTIDADGTEREIRPSNGTDFKLVELQFFTHSEIINLQKTFDGRWIVSDNNQLEKPVNVKASLLKLNGDQKKIHGKVLVCKHSMIE